MSPNNSSYQIYAITYIGAEKKLVKLNNREGALFIVNKLENYFNIGEIGGPEIINQYDRKGGGSSPVSSAGGGDGDC